MLFAILRKVEIILRVNTISGQFITQQVQYQHSKRNAH